MIPLGSSPNVGILMPSGRTVSLEIRVQAPTRSLAVCATAVLGAANPTHSTVIALRARVVRCCIVASSDFQRNRLLPTSCADHFGACTDASDSLTPPPEPMSLLTLDG